MRYISEHQEILLYRPILSKKNGVESIDRLGERGVKKKETSSVVLKLQEPRLFNSLS
jgi:hypothetical protein